MDVLEAFDLTRSYRSAAQLCGVDHHTVRRYVAARDAGRDPTSLATGERSSLSDPFIEKIEEWAVARRYLSEESMAALNRSRETADGQLEITS